MLERFVSAVEDLVKCWKEQNDMYRQIMLRDEVPREPMPREPVPEPSGDLPPVEASPEEARREEEPQQEEGREEVKKKLDALGVAYNPKARTSTLIELLNTREEKRKDENAEAVLPAREDPPAREDTPKVFTVEDCRRKLREVSIISGKDEAYRMLAEHCNGARGLMEARPADFPKLIEACQELIDRKKAA